MITKYNLFLKESNDDGFEILENIIDPNTAIWNIFPTYKRFDFFEEQFDKLGHAFYSPEYNVVFLDQRIMNEDWYTENHLYVIVAHEYGHKLAKHQHSNDLQSEKEADYIGYHVLKSRNLIEASNILYDLFYDRYNIEIEDFDGSPVEDIINQFSS